MDDCYRGSTASVLYCRPPSRRRSGDDAHLLHCYDRLHRRAVDQSRPTCVAPLHGCLGPCHDHGPRRGTAADSTDAAAGSAGDTARSYPYRLRREAGGVASRWCPTLEAGTAPSAAGTPCGENSQAILNLGKARRGKTNPRRSRLPRKPQREEGVWRGWRPSRTQSFAAAFARDAGSAECLRSRSPVRRSTEIRA